MKKIFIFMLVMILVVPIVFGSIVDVCNSQKPARSFTYQYCSGQNSFPDFENAGCQTILSSDAITINPSSGQCDYVVGCVIDERKKELDSATGCPLPDVSPPVDCTSLTGVAGSDCSTARSIVNGELYADHECSSDMYDEAIVKKNQCDEEESRQTQSQQPLVDCGDSGVNSFIQQLNRFIEATKGKTCFTESEWNSAKGYASGSVYWTKFTKPTRHDVCRECRSSITNGGCGGPCTNCYSSTASYNDVKCPVSNSVDVSSSQTTQIISLFDGIQSDIDSCSSPQSCASAYQRYENSKNQFSACTEHCQLNIDPDKMKTIRCYFNPQGEGCGKCYGSGNFGSRGWCIVGGTCKYVDSDAFWSKDQGCLCYPTSFPSRDQRWTGSKCEPSESLLPDIDLSLNLGQKISQNLQGICRRK